VTVQEKNWLRTQDVQLLQDLLVSSVRNWTWRSSSEFWSRKRKRKMNETLETLVEPWNGWEQVVFSDVQPKTEIIIDWNWKFQMMPFKLWKQKQKGCYQLVIRCQWRLCKTYLHQEIIKSELFKLSTSLNRRLKCWKVLTFSFFVCVCVSQGCVVREEDLDWSGISDRNDELARWDLELQGI
jgi:hypothetical protein